MLILDRRPAIDRESLKSSVPGDDLDLVASLSGYLPGDLTRDWVWADIVRAVRIDMAVSHDDAGAIKNQFSTAGISDHHQAVTARFKVPGDQWSKVHEFHSRTIQFHVTSTDLDPEVLLCEVNVHMHLGNMAAAVLQSDRHHETFSGNQYIGVPNDCRPKAVIVRSVRWPDLWPLCRGLR